MEDPVLELSKTLYVLPSRIRIESNVVSSGNNGVAFLWSKCGNTGNGAFKWDYKIGKHFVEINTPKRNYWILKIGIMGRWQKVAKFDFQS